MICPCVYVIRRAIVSWPILVGTKTNEPVTVHKVSRVLTLGSDSQYYRSMKRDLARAKALFDKGSREAILAFLQEIDPNGSWSDSASYADGLDPLTFDEALIELEDVIKELEAVPA
jgi:hypothetical protein